MKKEEFRMKKFWADGCRAGSALARLRRDRRAGEIIPARRWVSRSVGLRWALLDQKVLKKVRAARAIRITTAGQVGADSRRLLQAQGAIPQWRDRQSLRAKKNSGKQSLTVKNSQKQPQKIAADEAKHHEIWNSQKGQ